MICPFCGSKVVKITDTRFRRSINARYRRRLCVVCNEKFTTYEVVADEYEIDRYLSAMSQEPCKHIGEWKLKFVES